MLSPLLEGSSRHGAPLCERAAAASHLQLGDVCIGGSPFTENTERLPRVFQVSGHCLRIFRHHESLSSVDVQLACDALDTDI